MKQQERAVEAAVGLLDDLVQPGELADGLVDGVLEQRPAHAFLAARAPVAVVLGAAHLVDGLAAQRHDMERVEAHVRAGDPVLGAVAFS